MVRLEEIDELDSSFEDVQREKIIASDGATNHSLDILRKN